MRSKLLIAAGFVFLALASAWAMIPLITSYAPPEPPFERKLIRCAILVPLVVVVAAVLARMTRSRRRVLIPLLGFASIWPWVALVTYFFITDGPPSESDLIVFYPIPFGFLLAWLGISIGRGLRPRGRVEAP